MDYDRSSWRYMNYERSLPKEDLDCYTLEVDAKHVITKVLTEQKINAEEIAILLNWFDKVRIGLWLISSDAHVQSCFLYCYAPFWDKHIENNADFYDFLNNLLFNV